MRDSAHPRVKSPKAESEFLLDRKGRALAPRMHDYRERGTMLPFDRFIRPSMTVRDVKTQYPGTRAIFEALGFRDACDDCSIEIAARRQ